MSKFVIKFPDEILPDDKKQTIEFYNRYVNADTDDKRKDIINQFKKEVVGG